MTEAGDNNTITSDIKKNNGLGTEKNLKSKRSLFQAPVTGDSQVKSFRLRKKIFNNT